MSLVFENKVPIAYRAAFVKKVVLVSKNLGLNPNWLMAIMGFETGYTFSPSITNSLGYTGLIQFGTKAATALGTTTTALRSMTAVQQLDFVEQYYKMWYKSLKISAPVKFVDVYLITLFPLAVNKGNDFVMQSKDISARLFRDKNSGLDLNKNGIVTVGEIEQKMLKNIPEDFIKDFKKKA